MPGHSDQLLQSLHHSSEMQTGVAAVTESALEIGEGSDDGPRQHARHVNSLLHTILRPICATLGEINWLKYVKLYILIVQLRLAYVCMCFAIIGSGISLSICAQGFFPVAYSDQSRGDILLAVIGVPVCFAILAFLINQLVELFFDILRHRHNPLVWCRSVFLVLIKLVLGNCANSHQVSQVGLVLFSLLLDVYPLSVAFVYGYYSGWELRTIIGQLMRKTLLGLMIVSIFLTTLKIVLRLSGHWHQVEDAKNHFEEHPLTHYFSRHVTGQSRDRRFAPAKSSIVLDRSFHDEDKYVYRKKIINRFLLMCLMGLASFLTVFFFASISWGLFFQVLFMISIQIFLKQLIPRFYSGTYMSLVVAYALLVITTIGLAQSDITSNDPGIKLEQANSGPAYNAMVGFPLCAQRWGNDEDNNRRLNVFDFLVLADAVYANDCKGGGSVYEKISKAVEGTDLEGFKVEECQKWRNLCRYAVIYFPNVKKRVLAIRGTQIQDEIIADATLMSSVALLNALNPIVNIENLLREKSVRWLLEYLNLNAWFGVRPEPFVPHLLKAKALQQQARENGIDFFVTGHSLGGLFAAIVGGRLGIPAIAFNPPGQRLMLKRYGLTNVTQLQMYLTVIKPDKDPVPKVDLQVGNVHQIPCAASCKMGKCFSQCHMLAVELCQLYSECRDPRRRVLPGSLRSYCKHIGVPV